MSRSEWRSRKARDLLKIMVARRGRASPRDMLMEALWPEEPPERTENRLSVAVAVLRGLLDPGHVFDPQHFVVAEGGALRLDLTDMGIDVETFVQDAQRVLSRARPTPSEGDLAVLGAVEAAYTGDFLEEDLYEDWSAPVREQARALYIEVARTLARAALAAEQTDRAVDYLGRLLERDRYDEEAHLGMVKALARAGRHGEARRRYRAYVSALQEIGVEPVPYPVL